MKLPGKDYKSPQSFPFGTPYVEIRDFLANQNEELFRRNSVLGLLERDAATKRAPERWQALDSEEVASFDVVVCFESRVFDLVVEGTFWFDLKLQGCLCFARFFLCLWLGLGLLVGDCSNCASTRGCGCIINRTNSSCSGGCSCSSTSSKGSRTSINSSFSSIGTNSSGCSYSSSGSGSCSNSGTDEAAEVGSLGAVDVVEKRGVGRVIDRGGGRTFAVRSGLGPDCDKRKKLRFATPKAEECSRNNTQLSCSRLRSLPRACAAFAGLAVAYIKFLHTGTVAQAQS